MQLISISCFFANRKFSFIRIYYSNEQNKHRYVRSFDYPTTVHHSTDTSENTSGISVELQQSKCLSLVHNLLTISALTTFCVNSSFRRGVNEGQAVREDLLGQLGS